jgi:hypothetical protein
MSGFNFNIIDYENVNNMDNDELLNKILNLSEK